MSRGALKELISAPMSKFTRMTENIPSSEKMDVIRVLRHLVHVLGGLKK